jgi:hypothetical protein
MLWCHELFGAQLEAQNCANDPKTTTAAEVSFTDPDETKTENCDQLEGENLIRDQKMEGGSSEGEQRAGIKEEGKCTH